MIWTLIWIVAMSPPTNDVIGYFDTYEKCHAEAVWQKQNSAYYSQWACVQTIKPERKAKP